MKYKRIIVGGLGDFLKTQKKDSPHYCFVKSLAGNLAGPGDSFKTQMKYKRIIVLSEGGSWRPRGLFEIINETFNTLLFCQKPWRKSCRPRGLFQNTNEI